MAHYVVLLSAAVAELSLKCSYTHYYVQFCLTDESFSEFRQSKKSELWNC